MRPICDSLIVKAISAAEVSAENDTVISALDIIRTRQVILGLTSNFPGSRLWQFTNSDYVFPIPSRPFQFEKTRSYTNITSNKVDQNFIGIKLGDLNGSWNHIIP